jgi:phosphohistidine phosphatase SixA
MARAYLVRHGKAGDRYKFSGPDRERPLTAGGRRQADQIALQVAGEEDAPVRVLSSPAVRCVQTLEPLAVKLGVTLETVPWLDEGADAEEAYRLIRPTGGTVAACTHGDVMWGVLERLARAGIDLGDRPDAPKGCTWVLEWAAASSAGAHPARAWYVPPPSKA